MIKFDSSRFDSNLTSNSDNSHVFIIDIAVVIVCISHRGIITDITIYVIRFVYSTVTLSNRPELFLGGACSNCPIHNRKIHIKYKCQSLDQIVGFSSFNCVDKTISYFLIREIKIHVKLNMNHLSH